MPLNHIKDVLRIGELLKCETKKSSIHNLPKVNSVQKHRISSHKPDAPIPVESTVIETGMDLSVPGEVELSISMVDNNATGRPWSITNLPIDLMIKAKGTNNEGTGFCHVYDNDYCIVTLLDLKKGIISISDQGREMSYVSSSVWINI